MRRATGGALRSAPSWAALMQGSHPDGRSVNPADLPTLVRWLLAVQWHDRPPTAPERDPRLGEILGKSHPNQAVLSGVQRLSDHPRAQASS